MEKQVRIKVTNLEVGVMCLIGGAIVSYLLLSHIMEQSIMNIVLMLILWIVGIGDTVTNLMNTVFLTETGVEVCRFGKNIRKLPWEEIVQICIADDFRFTVGTSKTPLIMFVPKGCEKYDYKQCSGNEYRQANKSAIISILYTKQSEEFIKNHYQQIDDFVYCKK